MTDRAGGPSNASAGIDARRVMLDAGATLNRSDGDLMPIIETVVPLNGTIAAGRGMGYFHGRQSQTPTSQRHFLSSI